MCFSKIFDGMGSQFIDLKFAINIIEHGNLHMISSMSAKDKQLCFSKEFQINISCQSFLVNIKRDMYNCTY